MYELYVKPEVDKIFPKLTDSNSKIVRAAKEVLPNAKLFAMNAGTDMTWVDAPAIILGPGSLNQAHVANEYVEISQLENAVYIYENIINTYFQR